MHFGVGDRRQQNPSFVLGGALLSEFYRQKAVGIGDGDPGKENNGATGQTIWITTLLQKFVLLDCRGRSCSGRIALTLR